MTMYVLVHLRTSFFFFFPFSTVNMTLMLTSTC